MGAKFSYTIKANRLDQEPWFLQVLEYCSWDERAHTFEVCKSVHSMTGTDLFWRWLCRRLAAEHGVYVPHVAPRFARGFRQVFRELFPMKDMWMPKEVCSVNETLIAAKTALVKSDRSKIKVFARFRPKDDRSRGDENTDPAVVASSQSGKSDSSNPEVTLPLHQRLAMIKLSHRLSSNRQALKILTSEGGKWTIATVTNLSCVRCDGPVVELTRSTIYQTN